MMGALSPEQVRCLEGRLAGESVQTAKDKISRVLIQNAQAAGDKAAWEKYVRRHLEDIDRSDPDLCFSYAVQLSRKGVGSSTAVIKWADYALENKQKWSGETYKKRVYTLYQLKAQAASKLWQDAANKNTAEPSDEMNAKAEKYRGMTKEFSKEWLDYARASAQDTKAPMQLCASSGTAEFCGG